MDTAGKKTPLYECHLAAEGKLVPFGGYLLPVQYPTGVIREHMAVRQAAGLFDVSHMGEFLLAGKDALANLNLLLTNDFSGMADGQARYSPMCNAEGNVLDDLLVYRLAEGRYMLVVNASNREKDAAWIQSHLFGDAVFTDVSDETALLAMQGPAAKGILEKLTDTLPTKYYHFIEQGMIGEISCLISRTGYTGEHGYELYLPNEEAAKLWNLLLEIGQEQGLIPCGLGARDTLRLEAGMPLYGHEMDETVDPLEAGLGFFVKMQKEDFMGKEALLAKAEAKRERVGLRVTGRGIIREAQPVFLGGEQIGLTTSGTHCPFLDGAYAMALLQVGRTEVGTEVEVLVRGRKLTAEVVALPFYKRK